MVPFPIIAALVDFTQAHTTVKQLGYSFSILDPEFTSLSNDTFLAL